MKGIKERAEEYYINYCVQDTATGYDAYIAGADDQKKIDIDKACDYWYWKLREILNQIQEGKDISKTGEMVEFKKAMEEEFNENN